MKSLTWILLPVAFGCSTTYRVATRDLEQIKAGTQVANVRDDGHDVDLTHYTFDFHVPDKRAAQRVRGIESFNHLVETNALTSATDLTLVPNREDKPWQRIGLGGGVGFVSGFGIGFAVTNRIAIERQAQDGSACHDCSIGTVLLGSFVSAVIGAATGGLLAYFAGTGLGETKPATLELLEPSSQPASQPY
jgi:hypothetical protein